MWVTLQNISNMKNTNVGDITKYFKCEKYYVILILLKLVDSSITASG